MNGDLDMRDLMTEKDLLPFLRKPPNPVIFDDREWPEEVDCIGGMLVVLIAGFFVGLLLGWAVWG